MMDAWPPLNYVNKAGRPEGIGVDYVAALNKRLNGAIELVPGPFKQNQERVLRGELDGLMDITQRPEREAQFLFSRPYIVIPHVIVGRKGGDYYHREADLAGKVLALERGFRNVVYFKENFPSVVVREYDSTARALDAVSRGEADAYAGNRAVAVYLIEQELLNNLQLMGSLAEPRSILQFGVSHANRPLQGILDKALASLTVEEERVIAGRWIAQQRDYSLIGKVVGGSLTVIILFAIWNRRLKKEVQTRLATEAQLRVEQERVEQVLLNLLSNAVKFTETGGITVRAVREDSDYVVTLSDTGIGIKPEDRERLFKPFYQIDSGLTRKYEGTGLGLSICMKLVELMRGTISLQSEVGKGSIFSVRLPFALPY